MAFSSNCIVLEPRAFETERGRIVLRPQDEGDGTFLFALFRADCVAKLGLAAMPEAAVDQLVSFQYGSRDQTYRNLYPDAGYSIVLYEGEAIGRIVTHDDGKTVYVVDVALRPERQGQGFGKALLRGLMRDWGAAGRGARAEVVVTNLPSLKLWRSLGFTEESIDAARVRFRWNGP